MSSISKIIPRHISHPAAQILAERAGVVSQHLAVEMNEKKMTMLYKIDKGIVQEEHYGLALARVAGLPSQVIKVAQEVSISIDARAAAKRRSSKAFALARRRKLVLNLRESLMQARDGAMERNALMTWLRRLQEEFVVRMEQIENDAAVSDGEEGSETD
jgi:DNA mismatch repair protein MSH4